MSYAQLVKQRENATEVDTDEKWQIVADRQIYKQNRTPYYERPQRLDLDDDPRRLRVVRLVNAPAEDPSFDWQLAASARWNRAIPLEDRLIECEVWLRQGDLLSHVPCPVPTSGTGAHTLEWSVEVGPALLVTYDCQIDKRAAEVLQFMPARPISALTKDKVNFLRKDLLDPYNTFRMGVSTNGIEYFGRLNEIFWVPLWALGDSTYHDLEDGEPPRRCLQSCDRAGTLPEARSLLLHAKILAFWTGTREDQSAPPLPFPE